MFIPTLSYNIKKQLVPGYDTLHWEIFFDKMDIAKRC